MPAVTFTMQYCSVEIGTNMNAVRKLRHQPVAFVSVENLHPCIVKLVVIVPRYIDRSYSYIRHSQQL
ncbi:hypothetical protein AG1IA_10258 [Rhizoctonia solani AG-1 IA]|uniref:Uncharacterized protein n=1 Tax=Thanatephorus cucumeris (strain AG1-IA) TaxID=983506 RepID=L8WG70_THACA|nr:hypothetical protein AG1IA_10258 [Rhizoctonia solani AG-1 IA]